MIVPPVILAFVNSVSPPTINCPLTAKSPPKLASCCTASVTKFKSPFTITSLSRVVPVEIKSPSKLGEITVALAVMVVEVTLDVLIIALSIVPPLMSIFANVLKPFDVTLPRILPWISFVTNSSPATFKLKKLLVPISVSTLPFNLANTSPVSTFTIIEESSACTLPFTSPV